MTSVVLVTPSSHRNKINMATKLKLLGKRCCCVHDMTFWLFILHHLPFFKCSIRTQKLMGRICMSPARIGSFQLIVSLIGLIICTQVDMTELVYHYRNKKMSSCTICINYPLLFLINIIILK